MTEAKDIAKHLIQELTFQIQEHYVPKRHDDVPYYSIIAENAAKDCAFMAVTELAHYIYQSCREPQEFLEDIANEIENL
jgi:hypothetical protein